MRRYRGSTSDWTFDWSGRDRERMQMLWTVLWAVMSAFVIQVSRKQGAWVKDGLAYSGAKMSGHYYYGLSNWHRGRGAPADGIEESDWHIRAQRRVATTFTVCHIGIVAGEHQPMG